MSLDLYLKKDSYYIIYISLVILRSKFDTKYEGSNKAWSEQYTFSLRIYHATEGRSEISGAMNVL